jgi:hypothetical protein
MGDLSVLPWVLPSSADWIALIASSSLGPVCFVQPAMLSETMMTRARTDMTLKLFFIVILLIIQYGFLLLTGDIIKHYWGIVNENYK